MKSPRPTLSNPAETHAKCRAGASEAKCPPLPWHSEPFTVDASGLADCGIVSIPHEGHGYAVVRAPHFATKEQWNATAALIVRAVNAHEALVEACEAMLYTDHESPNMQAAWDAGEAALALAKGGAA